MHIHSAAKSDVGKVRLQNEDAWVVEPNLGLYIVADGMGGHAGGQLAASLAVATVVAEVTRHINQLQQSADLPTIDQATAAKELAAAVRVAASVVYARAQQQPELAGMGTTLTALLTLADRAFVAHVGDSRCYLLRSARMVQITDDHSLVNEQVKAGMLSPAQARSSRFKNIITRSVGFEADVAVDTFALPLNMGDRLLLCSDGLSNLVDDAEMGEILTTQPCEAACTALVELANHRGGDDNITVIVIAVDRNP